MSTLDDAKMISLRDKHLAQEAEEKKKLEEIKEKKLEDGKKGRRKSKDN